MNKPLTQIVNEMVKNLPKSEPVPPNPFALGVAEELRNLAAQIETGDLMISHFSLTADQHSAKQRLEIEVV